MQLGYQRVDYDQRVDSLAHAIEHSLPTGMPIEPAAKVMVMAIKHNIHPSSLMRDIRETTEMLSRYTDHSHYLGIRVQAASLNTGSRVTNVYDTVDLLAQENEVPVRDMADIVSVASDTGIPLDAFAALLLNPDSFIADIGNKAVSLRSIAVGLKYDHGPSTVQTNFINLRRYMPSVGPEAWNVLEFAYSTHTVPEVAYREVKDLAERKRMPIKEASALMLVASTPKVSEFLERFHG